MNLESPCRTITHINLWRFLGLGFGDPPASETTYCARIYSSRDICIMIHNLWILRSPGICDVFGGRIWGIHSPNRAWWSNPDNRLLLIKNRDFPIPVKVYFVEKGQRVVCCVTTIGCVSLPINLEQICLMRLLCRNRIPSHRDQAVNF